MNATERKRESESNVWIKHIKKYIRLLVYCDLYYITKKHCKLNRYYYLDETDVHI